MPEAISENIVSDVDSSAQYQKYRRYLRFLARTLLSSKHQNKVDPSDMVQLALLKAFECRAQFHGTSEEEKIGWLRRILIRTIARFVREINAQGRDFKRESAIEEVIEKSSSRLHHFLVSPAPTPSDRLHKAEFAVSIAEAIENLPEAQRHAVLLKYWHHMTLAEIATDLNTTVPSVAGLLHRGMKTLKRQIQIT